LVCGSNFSGDFAAAFFSRLWAGQGGPRPRTGKECVSTTGIDEDQLRGRFLAPADDRTIELFAKRVALAMRA